MKLWRFETHIRWPCSQVMNPGIDLVLNISNSMGVQSGSVFDWSCDPNLCHRGQIVVVEVMETV